MSYKDKVVGKISVKIVTVTNQKGGVGKTTTAINLGTALALSGKKVLVIDMDPQGNATTGLGITNKKRHGYVYDVVVGDSKFSEVYSHTIVPNLDIIASSIDLSAVESDLASYKNKSKRLRECIFNDIEFIDTYDYVLIDSPPSLSLLTINSMVAANSVIVPLQCEFYALQGLAQLMETISRIKKKLNTSLILRGVVLTMYDRRNNLCVQVVEDARKCLGSFVFDTVIPRSVKISESPSHSLPVLLYAVKSTGSGAYISLANELLMREGKAVA